MRLLRPRDPFPYPADPRSRPICAATEPGRYVYVQEEVGEIYVVPDTEPHLHPRVLGAGQPALYAGDLVLQAGGVIVELTNLSGTFRCKNRGGLLAVAELLRARGLLVQENAIRWFDPEAGTLVILG